MKLRSFFFENLILNFIKLNTFFNILKFTNKMQILRFIVCTFRKKHS